MLLLDKIKQNTTMHIGATILIVKCTVSSSYSSHYIYIICNKIFINYIVSASQITDVCIWCEVSVSVVCGFFFIEVYNPQTESKLGVFKVIFVVTLWNRL